MIESPGLGITRSFGPRVRSSKIIHHQVFNGSIIVGDFGPYLDTSEVLDTRRINHTPQGEATEGNTSPSTYSIRPELMAEGRAMSLSNGR